MAVPLNRWHVIIFRQNLLTVGSSSFRCIVWKRPGSDFTFTRWRHQMETFSALLAVCAGNSPVSGEFPHKGQWRGALVFSRICAWINDWVKNGGAGDLRHYRTHYAVSVMQIETIGFTELNLLALGRLDDNLKCNLRTLYLGLLPSGNKPLPEPMLTPNPCRNTRSDITALRSLSHLSGANELTYRVTFVSVYTHWCVYIRSGDRCIERKWTEWWEMSNILIPRFQT